MPSIGYRQRRAADQHGEIASLPWDVALSAKFCEHDKPDPEVISARKTAWPEASASDDVRGPHHDLKAAQKLGLKTVFVARPTGYGPLQKHDFEANGDWNVIGKNLWRSRTGLGVNFLLLFRNFRCIWATLGFEIEYPRCAPLLVHIAAPKIAASQAW